MKKARPGEKTKRVRERKLRGREEFGKRGRVRGKEGNRRRWMGRENVLRETKKVYSEVNPTPGRSGWPSSQVCVRNPARALSTFPQANNVKNIETQPPAPVCKNRLAPLKIKRNRGRGVWISVRRAAVAEVSLHSQSPCDQTFSKSANFFFGGGGTHAGGLHTEVKSELEGKRGRQCLKRQQIYFVCFN